MTPCWTRDLCIWHYTEWRHVGLVICVSDIIQNDGMLDLWSVYLTLYRMTTCWTRDLCIWHNTEWRYVGLVICVSDIIQNDNMLDSWSVHLTLYRMTPWDHESNMLSFCIMSDTQITSPTYRHSVLCQIHRSRVQHGVILYNVRCTDHESNIILYNAKYIDHKSNMPSFCIMSDTHIMSPTLHHHV